ncbi:hypothetical protein AK812_SmicGene38159 [Symbiodinium microadriaticum]|uniref:Uncharacterized protein n=1 Tax=Symbiodinium microadriaticum TaxID=2951 RepID=A0A1Q9CEQ3_SYMMI|nr:hypothetical protein AK812_SmicGene38159 [Symbiodinium microadriaticum]
MAAKEGETELNEADKVQQSISVKERGAELYKQQKFQEAREAWEEDACVMVSLSLGDALSSPGAMVAEVTVLKDLQGALEQQRMSLEALHRRQSELSEENAALRECLESLGILCGQAFLSRLHRRRLERVLSRHPMSQTQATLEAVLRTSELAVTVASYSGPSFCQSRAAARGIWVSTPELDRLFPASIYVVGGAGSVSNRPLRTLECFSPATKQCETRAPMLQPRCGKWKRKRLQPVGLKSLA